MLSDWPQRLAGILSEGARSPGAAFNGWYKSQPYGRKRWAGAATAEWFTTLDAEGTEEQESSMFKVKSCKLKEAGCWEFLPGCLHYAPQKAQRSGRDDR